MSKFNSKIWLEICDKIEQGYTTTVLAKEYGTYRSSITDNYQKLRGRTIRQFRHGALLERRRAVLEKRNHYVQKMIELQEELTHLGAETETLDDDTVMYILK